MGKTSNKSTETTAKERYELIHFNKLPDLNPDDWIGALGKKVWVKKRHGILRGEIKYVNIISDKVIIDLENSEKVILYPYKGIRKNYIKERSP